jgi:hypothetical protein
MPVDGTFGTVKRLVALEHGPCFQAEYNQTSAILGPCHGRHQLEVERVPVPDTGQEVKGHNQDDLVTARDGVDHVLSIGMSGPEVTLGNTTWNTNIISQNVD